MTVSKEAYTVFLGHKHQGKYFVQTVVCSAVSNLSSEENDLKKGCIWYKLMNHLFWHSNLQPFNHQPTTTQISIELPPFAVVRFIGCIVIVYNYCQVASAKFIVSPLVWTEMQAWQGYRAQSGSGIF